MARQITFLNGIALRRHQYQVRKPPPDHVFLRVRDSVTKKQTATPPGVSRRSRTESFWSSR